jgi:hypothetical protein
MEITSVSALAARPAFARAEFPGYAALTDQLPQIGLAVPRRRLSSQWRAFALASFKALDDGIEKQIF